MNELAPFQPGEQILCIQDAPELHIDGSLNNNCRCAANHTYTIDGCYWAYNFGWMVMITGELHNANNFRKINS